MKPRITTGEAAEILGCDDQEALMLLKAAGVTTTRKFPRGAHHWDYAEFCRLLKALGKKPPK